MNQNEKLFVLIFGLIFIFGVGIASFILIEDSGRSGEQILLDVQQTYNSSDGISAETEVLVENGDEKVSFNLDVATEGDRFRINVSGKDTYRTLGTNGNNIWVFDPRTDLTGVIASPEESGINVSVRAGTDENLPARIPSIIEDEITENTTVGELRQQFGDRLPEELEGLDENTTILELTEELNSSILQDAEGQLDRSEALPNSSEFEKSATDVLGLFDSLDVFYNVGSDLLDTSVTNTTRTEVTKIGSTEINNGNANELLINYSRDNTRQRLYVSKDDDTLLKQNITIEDSSVIIQYNETNLDVQAAESTFEPPGITKIFDRSLDIGQLIQLFGSFSDT